MDRTSSTGVLLSGEKGSGKTLLAKSLALKGGEQDIPTIVINAPWHGDVFNKLVQDITQPCIILFDEFEKVYNEEEQNSMLTLLDGVYPSKKLFILTCNDKWRINQHMRNRPGRIFYSLEFRGLESEFIEEYCQENLNAKQHIEKVVQIASLFSEFNFDMLKALVEDMNRYNETPQEALRMLNAKPEYDSGSRYDVSVVHAGKPIPLEDLNPRYFEGNPLQPRGVYVSFDSDPEASSAYVELKLTQNDLVKMLPKEGKFVFQQNETLVTMTREKEKVYHWDAF
jgi:hypothetical protein